MFFSESCAAGFALAATIARDPGGAAARPGLADDIADSLTRTARELATLGKAARRARVRDLAEPPEGSLPSKPGRPVRAFALLARTHGRGRRIAWLQAAALPRPGYTPHPELLALLARIVQRLGPEHAAWDA